MKTRCTLPFLLMAFSVGGCAGLPPLEVTHQADLPVVPPNVTASEAVANPAADKNSEKQARLAKALVAGHAGDDSAPMARLAALGGIRPLPPRLTSAPEAPPQRAQSRAAPPIGTAPSPVDQAEMVEKLRALGAAYRLAEAQAQCGKLKCIDQTGE